MCKVRYENLFFSGPLTLDIVRETSDKEIPPSVALPLVVFTYLAARFYLHMNREEHAREYAAKMGQVKYDPPIFWTFGDAEYGRLREIGRIIKKKALITADRPADGNNG